MSDSNSSSDSSQTQLQESQDNRITGGTGSVALVASRSSVGGDVNLTSTDFGTVSKAFDFATGIAKGAADESAASGGRVVELATSAMSSVKQAYATSNGTVQAALDSVAQAYKNSNTTMADAYENSKAGEQKVMVGVGLVVVAIVAFKALGKA